MTYVIFFVVSMLASVAGAICGVGGGVFMKPALDAVGVLPVSTITFLSGCTVISMTSYNVISSAIHSKQGEENLINWSLTTWLGIGAGVGGIIGTFIYQSVKASFENQNMVGGYQAIVLFIAVGITLIYTLNKSRIPTHHVTNKIVLLLLGAGLGTLSSFAGIGGGPMNLAVLIFFLSMSTKESAQNSLYMILISQVVSLITTFIQGGVPKGLYEVVEPGLYVMLIGMMLCGIFGGIIGKRMNKKLPAASVDQLFVFLMIVIMGICVWNAYSKLFAIII